MSSTRTPKPGVRGESRTSYIKWTALKERVSFEMILRRYDWMRYMDEGRRGQLTGPCPIHTDGTPDASSTSFKVTPSGKGFKCWSCGAQGSIIDFVAGKENVSPTQAGHLINEWFPEASSEQEEPVPSDGLSPYQAHVYGQMPVYTTRLVRETTLDVEDFLQCKSPPDVVAFLQRYYRDHDREEFVALLFDTAMQCVGLVSVSIGGRNASIVEPAQVFKAAILGHADSLILAHNHPSGNPEPSRADIGITKQLREAGEMMGIPIRDHLVVTRRSFTSLAERGLI